MANDDKDAPKGFAGLDDMVSGIDPPPARQQAPPTEPPTLPLRSHPTPAAPPMSSGAARTPAPAPEPAAPARSFQVAEPVANASTSGQSNTPWPWILGIGFLVICIFIASQSSDKGNSTADSKSQASSSMAPPERIFFVVAATSANLREKPSSHSRQLKVLHFGDRLEYVMVADIFTQVKLADSTMGYMASELMIPAVDFDRLGTVTAHQYVDQRAPERRLEALLNQTQLRRDQYIQAIASIASRSIEIKTDLQSLEDLPPIVVTPDKSAGTVYSLAAKVSANSGNVDAAFWNARAAIEADPTNPDYHVALALASYQGGNVEAVKAAAGILPILAPKATNAWMIFGLAEALNETGELFDEVAVGSFVLAIKLSKNVVVTRKYFNALIDKSDKPRVRRLLAEALAEESKNTSAFGY